MLTAVKMQASLLILLTHDNAIYLTGARWPQTIQSGNTGIVYGRVSHCVGCTAFKTRPISCCETDAR